MFTSLSVSNFRCFEELSFDESLDRVNLIAGTNSVGKTALLEAIYVLIGMGNAELILRLSAFRGAGVPFAGEPRQFSELFWEPIFHNLDSSQDIQIGGLHSGDEHIARLRIDRAPSAKITPYNGRVEGDNTGLGSITVYGDVLKLAHTKPDGSTIETSMMLVAGEGGGVGVRMTPVPPEPAFGGSYLATHQTRSLAEDAARYTRLESAGEPSDLLETLRMIEPRLERLRVGVVAGIPTLRGDIAIGRMIPLSLLGDGLSRLASILLTIADSSDGVVLIDEIENGFHHSVLRQVWQAINEAAHRYNTQVFATTHSFECIEAAHEAFREDREYAFRLHRLERIADETHVITYDQETLAAAIRTNLEVR